MRRLFDSLFSAYGPQHWWPAQGVEEMMIGAMLVQNTSWTQVTLVIDRMKEQKCLSLATIRQWPEEDLWTLLRPVGYFRVKSRRLKALADCLGGYDDQPERLFQMETDPLRQTLLQVHGVGKETADSILCYAACRPLFVVDAYTKRLFRRLGWIDEKTGYDAIQTMVHQPLPRDAHLLGELHALIVHHAKVHCRTKPVCLHCPLPFCPHHERYSP